MLDKAELKEKSVGICEELGGILPYEAVQIKGESWEDIADELADLARLIANYNSRIAAYASIAKRLANREINHA